MDSFSLNPEETNEEYQSRATETMNALASDKAFVDKDYLVIKEKGKVVSRLPMISVYAALYNRIESLCNKFISKVEEFEKRGYKSDDKSLLQLLLEDDDIEASELNFSEFASMLLVYQKAVGKLKSNTKEYGEFYKGATACIERAEAKVGKLDFDFFVCNAALIGLVDPNAMKKLFNDETTYSTDEAVSLIKRYVERDDFDKYEDIQLQFITEAPTEFLKKLEKNGYMKPKRKTHISPEVIKNCKKDLNYEERFLTAVTSVSAYLYGLMDVEHLKKNFKWDTFFIPKYVVKKVDKVTMEDEQGINFGFLCKGEQDYREYGKTLMEIINIVKPGTSEPICLWNYYVNGILTTEDMKELIQKDYIYEYEILNQLVNGRKISTEVSTENDDFPNDSKLVYAKYIFDEEKIYELFNADIMILSYLDEANQLDENVEIRKKYLNEYLKKRYEEDGKDLADEMMSSAIRLFDEQKLDEKQKIELILKMYNDGVIAANNFVRSKIDEGLTSNIIMRLFEDGKPIIDFYNVGLISRDSFLEMYDLDTSRIFEMINDGLNPDVLVTNCSTVEIVELCKMLSRACDLSCLRNDIDIEKIKELYQPDKKR